MTTQRIEQTARAQEYGSSERSVAEKSFDLHGEGDGEAMAEEFAESSHEGDVFEGFLQEIADAEGRVSFHDVARYRDVMADRWHRRVAAELAGLGVNVARRFRLTLDEDTGEATANPEHPHSLQINDYFRQEPEAARQFRSLVALGKLADAPRRRLTAVALEERLPVAAAAGWYRRNMDANDLFAGGGLLFEHQGSTYTGLDIRA